MPFDSGEIFAGFVLQRLLGVGGMGEVYLAQHPRLPRLDAVKILATDSTRDQEFRARFNREADLAATLWHPHIVGVHDRGEFHGRLWISMDYVDGTDAGHLLNENYPAGMPAQDVVEIVTAVADALDFAHERRLLHRDVKPANILVTNPNGGRRRVLLTDFGIARRTDDIDGLTEANIAMGTVTYAAPEQLMSKPLDGRADQYALAATTFHLLTGAPPFPDSSRAVVIRDHLTTPAPMLSEHRRELARLDDVLAKALSKDPGDRYPHCLDFARALTDRVEEAAPPAAPSPPADSGAHTAPLAAADMPGSAERGSTKRLDRVVVHGTARAVQHRPPGAGNQMEIWSFRLEPSDPTGRRMSSVPVELHGTSIAGHVADGDVVEVSGIWDAGTLWADTIVNHSAAQRRPPPVGGKAPIAAPPKPSRGRKARIVALVAGVVVIALLAAAGIFFTRGMWSGDGDGPIVKPVRATVFSPKGAADHPGEAGLAIDGDPATAWPTDTYLDASPFPVFKDGVGLMLTLSEPTALSAVTIDVSSTGTEVQIRSASTASPASLADTTELTPTVPLEPGDNRIPVKNRTKTSNVLVWITKLGTTDGQSRSEVSEITLQAQ